MTLEDPLAVVIATSKKRTNLLLNRSLESVYRQLKVNPKEVVVVDDNPLTAGDNFSKEFMKIKNGILNLRENVLKNTYKKYITNNNYVLFDNFFKTTLMKNERTRGHSGTGAWNTAIFYLYNKYKDLRLFVAILDDDDEYKENYLENCTSIIKLYENVAAIFPYIAWESKGKSQIFQISIDKLTQREFFIGNPGVQGSNMCIRLDVLVKTGAFDESLEGTTDRDLMIRLLDYIGKYNAQHKEKLEIKIIPELLIIYHANSPDRVTANKELKKRGLDVFYGKYKDRFSHEDFSKSLERARRLFGYEYTE